MFILHRLILNIQKMFLMNATSYVHYSITRRSNFHSQQCLGWTSSKGDGLTVFINIHRLQFHYLNLCVLLPPFLKLTISFLCYIFFWSNPSKVKLLFNWDSRCIIEWPCKRLHYENVVHELLVLVSCPLYRSNPCLQIKNVENI